MKLHIGPGNSYFPGWVNVDIFNNVKADIYSSALALPYPRETFDIIYASHVLEHFNRHLISAALFHWRDLLKIGGVLRLSVPNFETICKYYMETGKLQDVMGLLFGGQDSFLNEHHITFDYELLLTYLRSVGFQKFREWDWRNTEHSGIDDYSQAYLPHMDKENGLLMSLNIEAVKT